MKVAIQQEPPMPPEILTALPLDWHDLFSPVSLLAFFKIWYWYSKMEYE